MVIFTSIMDLMLLLAVHESPTFIPSFSGNITDLLQPLPRTLTPAFSVFSFSAFSMLLLSHFPVQLEVSSSLFSFRTMPYSTSP